MRRELPPQRRLLCGDEFAAALLRYVEHLVELLSAKETVLTGALDFNEVAGFLHYYVEVDLGAGVFLIGQIEADFTINNAYRDRSDGIK